MAGLNLGCGDNAAIVDHCPLPWLNVDMQTMSHWTRMPDVIADVRHRLPFPDHHYEAAYLGHVLEHLRYDTELPFALAEVARVCRPGAPVAVVGPCMNKARALHCDPDWITNVVMHHHCDHPGMSHYWDPTTEATLAAVRAHLDPDAVEVPLHEICPPSWPNPDWFSLYQCAVLAKVPSSPV